MFLIISSYDFATGISQCYPAERIAPVERQTVDDGPTVPVMTPAIDVDWLPGIARKIISKADRDYQHYSGATDHDAGQPADVPADAVYNVMRRGHFGGDDGSSSTADNPSVIATAFSWLSKTVSTSGSELVELKGGLVDNVKAPQTATAKLKKEIKRQRGLVSVAEKSKNNVLNDVARLCGGLCLPVQ